MAIRFDQIELANTGHQLYPVLQASNATRLRVQSTNGYVDIGSGTSSSWGYILTDRPNFYVDKSVYFDGNIQGYGGDETASFATYYDSNNTAYYVNPAGTSVLSTLTMYTAGATETTQINLPRAGFITFYGDNSTSHSIGSRSSVGSAVDDLRINSYGALYINLDSNNNNTSGADFMIGRHGGQQGTISDWAFKIDGETKDVGIGTTTNSDGDLSINAPKLHVKGADTTGAFNLIARFQGGNDSDNTGAAILINHNNDRGLLLSAGRKDSDREVAYFDLVSSGANLTRMFEIGKYGSDYISKFAKPVELADNFTQNSGNFITHGNQTGDLNSFWQIAGTSKNRGIATGRFQSGASNSFTSANNANWIMNIYSHAGSSGNYPYGIQLGGTDTGDRNLMIRGVSNGTFGSWARVFHENSSDLRSPIFYDSNDTNYYVDPNNTGISLKVAGRAEAYQFRGGVTASGDGDDNQPFALADDYSSWAIIFGEAWTNNNGWGIFWAGNDNPAYSYWSTTNPNEAVFVGGGNVRASIDLDNGASFFDNQVRTPILYDSNDTNYYVNPAGGAVIQTLTIDDYIYHKGDTNTYLYFETDSIKLRTGGDDRLVLNNNEAYFQRPVVAPNLGRNNDDQVLFAITEQDTSETIRRKLGNTGLTSITKVDDSTAPADGCFQLTDQYENITIPQFFKVDDNSEYTFEVWVRFVSGSDTDQKLYAGCTFFDSNKSSLGNTQRYWGESAEQIDANSRQDGNWYHFSGTLGPNRGTNTGEFHANAQWMKLILLLNYSSNANTVRYCGLKFYKSGGRQNRMFTSIYRKSLGSQGSNTSDSWLGKTVMDTSGNLYTPEKLIHYDDSDTYFSFSAANQMSFVAAGTTRLRVESDVKVLGSTDLNIQGTSRRLQFTAGTGTVRTTTANNLILQANSITRQTLSTGGYSQEAGSYRAPIFYDSSDTTYYLDPANTTTSLKTAGAGVFGAGGTASWGNSEIDTSTDAGWGTSNEYPYVGSNGGSAGSLIMFHNPHVPYRTDNPRSGASGRAGLRCAIDTAVTSWWDIGLIGDEFEIYRNASSTQLFRVTNGGNAIASSSFQAPIFYDSNDTSYYTNPAGTSNMNEITAASYIRSLGSYQVTLDGVSSSGPVIEFGATNDYDAYGSIGHQGGEYQFGTHSRDFAWYQGSTKIMELDYGGGNQEPVLAIGWNVAADNTKGTLQVFGHNNTDGTVRLGPHSSKGSIFSHVHYGSNGDWYIRPASNSGSVFVLNYSAISDERLKENIVDSEYGLSEITSLRPRNFNWIDSETDDVHTGFVAQEVEAVVSKWITQGELDDHKSVDYNAITATLVKAVQELKAENEDLLNRVKALENK